MAVITPFSDPNAHGSIAKTFSFRRSFAGVVFEKKPFPKQPNSAGQLAQRQAFIDAKDSWNSASGPEKVFFNARASAYSLTGYSLKLKANLNNIIPSTTPFEAKSCTSCLLINTRSTTPGGVSINIKVNSSPTPLGSVGDNENVFAPGTPVGAASPLYITLYTSGGLDVQYQFYDGLYLSVTDSLDVVHNFTIRFPSILVSSSTTFFYVADDGSIYYDQAMTLLAGTNIL